MKRSQALLFDFASNKVLGYPLQAMKQIGLSVVPTKLRTQTAPEFSGRSQESTSMAPTHVEELSWKPAKLSRRQIASKILTRHKSDHGSYDRIPLKVVDAL